jgi:uncharacterized Zn-binding protein involved in type VI secretion
MPPAARSSDMHVCPMVNPGPVPHVGGPETSGSPDVIVGFMPQGRVGDTLICVPAVDSVAMGSPTVLVNGRQAARLGDPTSHGGKLVSGCPTVIIGNSGQGSTLEKAKAAAAAKELEKPPPEVSPPPDAALAPPTSPVSEALAAAYDKAAVAKKEIDALSQQVADQLDGQVAQAPLKGEKRVLEKALEYAKKRGATEVGPQDIKKLKDFARNTIVVPAGREAEALAKLLELKPEIGEAFKVVSAAADPCGYSGMNVTVPTSVGMPSEVQINSPHMIYAKEKPEDARRILGAATYDALAQTPGMPPGGKGHAIYEVYRVLPVDSPRAAEVAAESRAYYAAVRAAAGVA